MPPDLGLIRATFVWAIKQFGAQMTAEELADALIASPFFCDLWRAATSRIPQAEGLTAAPAVGSWWFVERNDFDLSPIWLADALRPGDHYWTANPHLARKFPTREEAEAACCDGHLTGQLQVTEHAWVGEETAAPAAEEARRG